MSCHPTNACNNVKTKTPRIQVNTPQVHPSQAGGSILLLLLPQQLA
jgi:hypothetical protein